jgi:hypothetical protein
VSPARLSKPSAALPAPSTLPPAPPAETFRPTVEWLELPTPPSPLKKPQAVVKKGGDRQVGTRGHAARSHRAATKTGSAKANKVKGRG